MSSDGYWPDLKYIRQRISIRAVAGELGIQFLGNSVRCWRPGNHQHNDRTPSAGFTSRNRIRCHVCDLRPMDVSDLVRSALHVDLRAAIEWVMRHFDVPEVPKGKHASPREKGCRPVRVNVSGLPFDLEWMIRSGFWASLSLAEKAVLGALLGFADLDTRCAELSQRGIKRYAGLRSFTTVAKATKRFERIGLLKVETRDGRDGLRACNRYRLTLDSPEFLEYVDPIQRQKKAEVELEREFQRKRRNARRKASRPPLSKILRTPTDGKPQAQYTLGTTLSTQWSTAQFDAPPSGARDLTAALCSPPNSDGDRRRTHFESGIFRKRVTGAYFDCKLGGLSEAEAIREAIREAALDLTSNRAVELRSVDVKRLRDAAFERLQPHIQTLAAIGDYSRREQVVLEAVLRVVVDAALDEKARVEREPEAALA